MSTFGVSFKNNKEQQELVRLMAEQDKPIVICVGDAGTGKTMAALAGALDLQSDKRYRKIIYGRNPVPLGRDMGYMPGGLEEKYNPYLGGMYDNLESIARLSAFKPNPNDLTQRIEVLPIAYLRGRSFTDTVLIIDEAQNLDITCLKTILTRMGAYSKVVLLGSMNQIDEPAQRKKAACDFQQAIDKIKDLPYVGYVELTKSMRSPWCAEIDALLSEVQQYFNYQTPFYFILFTTLP